jgi:hypothetical protein
MAGITIRYSSPVLRSLKHSDAWAGSMVEHYFPYRRPSMTMDDHQVPTEPVPISDPLPDQEPTPEKDPVPDHNPVTEPGKPRA